MPVKQVQLGLRDVTVLRDTGCSGVVIRQSLVNKKNSYQDKSRLVV